MKDTIGTDDGYTLVELMIAFSIFALLLVMVYGTLFSQYSSLAGKIAMNDMIAESDRALKATLEVVDDYGDISINVAGDQVLSGGDVIIDFDDDIRQDGSMLNLDNINGVIIDNNDSVVADYVDEFVFVMGPDVYEDVEVVNGVLLVSIKMTSRGTSYSTKGGINVEK